MRRFTKRNPCYQCYNYLTAKCTKMAQSAQRLTKTNSCCQGCNYLIAKYKKKVRSAQRLTKINLWSSVKSVLSACYYTIVNSALNKSLKCFRILSFTSSSLTFSTPSSTFKEVTALPRIPQGMMLSK